MLSRYLGLTEEEMTDNERMWAEELGDIEKAPAGEAGLRSVGISPGGLDADIQAAELPVQPGAEGAAPGAGAPGGGAPVSDAGAAVTAPAPGMM